MTQNEVSIIKNSVLDATEAYVDARLAMADFVKTQIGVVTANPTKDSGGKYRHTVKCNATSGSSGVTYTNVLSVGNIGFPKNSVVFLVAPNAQYSNQFILGKLDSTPANIVGGEIHIGEIANTDPTQYYFNVDSTGKVNIKKGSINIADKFYVDDTGNLYLGGTTTSTANFYVTNTGMVTIKSGSILLNQYGTTGHYNVDINSTGIGVGWNGTSHNFSVAASDGSVTIKKGSMTIGSVFHIDSTGWLSVGGITSGANFYVDTTGSVTIKKGSINIANKFYVDTSGNLFVGGVNTTNANFYVAASDGSVTIKKGSINIGTNQFIVDSSGNLTAKYITANVGGQIGGWTIDSTTGLKKTGSHNDICTLYSNLIKIAQFNSPASNLVALDATNARVVVNSDSGNGYIIVSNQKGWDSSGNITNPQNGNYTKLAPSSVTLHNNSQGSATIGWNGAKFLMNGEDQGLENLRIYVGSSHIGFYNLSSGKVGSINLT